MRIFPNSTDFWTGFVGPLSHSGAGPQKHGQRSGRTMPKTKVKSKSLAARDQAFLQVAPEVSIFLACVSAVNELRQLATAYECGEVTRRTFSHESSSVVAGLNELAASTERFDIVCPVMEFGKFSPFFWRWFNWWNDYIKELTPRQISHLERLAREGEPTVNEQRPKADWVRYRHTPAFALVIT